MEIIDIQKINILLNDMWNFQLILFGLAVTLFTVIYSFIISKRDELRSIADTIKNGEQTAMIKQKETFAKNYIIRLKKINNNLIILILTTFLFSFCSWFAERFISEYNFELKKYILLTLATSTIILLTLIAKQSYKIFLHYKESTKV
ncbi:hypothetical protein EKM05_05980 [Flavobacterium sp. GSP27]|uniref:hypothetical protein n=1 Tax=Flavobacterium sp. GSP27 TaxID=2497489 RepID=UPI000F82EE84|nr:hypothetical protein [Flavobacterium sp. GSP27]RTZ09851.1 hypothetical protein EKM05_05980 [Flavobacterium sp. GSP27]